MRRQNKNISYKEKDKEDKFSLVVHGADLCIFCGEIVPEGFMVCPICESKTNPPRCSICNRIVEDFNATCPYCAEALLHSSDTKKE